MAVASPLESFISQFVQALQQEQTPQFQAVSQFFHQIIEPATSVICDIVQTIEPYQPASTPLTDFLHKLCDCDTAPEATTTNAQIQGFDLSNELHKAWDFHFT